MSKLMESPPGMPGLEEATIRTHPDAYANTDANDAEAETNDAETSDAETQAQPSVPVKTSPPDNERYFPLSRPIEVGGRIKQKLERLLVDVTELPGSLYFELTDRYAAEFPVQYQQSFTRFRDERFLTLLLIKLNPPMIEEDVRRIAFKDLPLLFIRLQNGIFAR